MACSARCVGHGIVEDAAAGAHFDEVDRWIERMSEELPTVDRSLAVHGHGAATGDAPGIDLARSAAEFAVEYLRLDKQAAGCGIIVKRPADELVPVQHLAQGHAVHEDLLTAT